MQSTNNIFLVRPANFAFNTQTAASNVFQHKTQETNVQQKALAEFNNLAQTLKNNGVNVNVFEDSLTPIKPDAIFPNNWISLHKDGTLVLYPMLAPNRRAEINWDFIAELVNKHNITRINDLTLYAKGNKFLEGTGSIVFDHINKVAYACISERTNPSLFEELCAFLNYTPILFNAIDENGKAIYHTNVLMCVGTGFVTICLDAIVKTDKERVLNSLNNSNLEIVDITFNQLNSFAGNMLELRNNNDDALIVLSQTAFNSLNNSQKETLNKYGKLLPININTIETTAGGSVRCMIAEIFNPLVS